MRDVLRSIVNPWDCDQMGHLNVRHYIGRFSDGLATLLQQLNLPPRTLAQRGLMVRARDQHVRFSRELRPGSTFSIQGGIVTAHPALTAYEELRTLDGEVSATSVTALGLIEQDSGAAIPWPADVADAASRERCAVPPYALVRGVTEHPTRARMTRGRASELGLLPGYLGPVSAHDCDAHGVMNEAACMARISDGISHTFRALYSGQDRPAGIGGAALEYRFVFHCWPRLGDIVEVRSALSALHSKALQYTHYMFELSSGECFATAQAVVVWFDLAARKAIAIPEDLRAELQARIVPGLAL